MKRLAIITSHPIQYFGPWFAKIAAEPEIESKVFYLWDFGVADRLDRGFGQKLTWDIPLLSGYEFEFVPNMSWDPGTHHIWGLMNPSLSRSVRRFNPDTVLMIGYNYESLYQFLLQSRMSRLPVIFRGDSHRLGRNGQQGLKERLRRTFIRGVFKGFSAVLYVGRANREYFEYHGVEPDRLFFAPHAVDNDRFFETASQAQGDAGEWRRSLGIPDKNQVVLFAGKFEEVKHAGDLIEAFCRAKAPDASLLLVGAGSLEQKLKQRASNCANVYFAPFQNQTEMPRAYAACDLFVLPSVSESWGLAINEAMCMGKPAIVSDRVGCAPDLVQSGRNGLVFPAGGIEALAGSLEEALSDPKRLKKWGQESRRIVSNYSYARATEGLKQALESVSVKGVL